MAEAVFSVSQINEYLNRKLWRDPFLSIVSVVGEVTNFNLSSVGHAFFSLKDEDNLLNCVMHEYMLNEDGSVICDGAQIIVTGRIAFYRKSGTIQLIAEKASAQGVGSLFAKFERTKKKLYEEGIFDASHKKALPEFPMNIGVVTSSSGAVMHDITVISTRRFEGIKITVYPIQVQGQDAPRQICEGIKYFNREKSVDVIIVGRGGGSFEDLYAFNEESVARAVYGSEIPVVSAVGHETDYTLCDMAADLRAPTPSAAAELVVREKKELIESLNDYKHNIHDSFLDIMNSYENKAERLSDSIKSYPFKLKLEQTIDKITTRKDVIKNIISAMIDRSSMQLEKYCSNLETLNPRNVLKRGYAIVYGENNDIITSSEAAEPDMVIEFSDGRVAVSRKD